MSDEHYLKRELYALVRSDPEIFDFLQSGSLDGVWYWDLEQPENEWMSPRFWTVFGHSPSDKEHLASEWQDMIHPDDLQTALDNFHKHCADPNHPYDQIVRYRHRDGSTVWVRCRGLVIRDSDGKPRRMLGAHTEVTEREKTIQKLLSSEERLAHAQEAASLGMFDWDIRSDHATCTDRYFALFGLPPQDRMLSEEDWLQMVHPQDRERAAEEVRRSLLEGEPYDTEYRVVWPDNSVHWVSSKAKLFFDADGPYRMIGTMADITERKLAQEELENKRRALEAANRDLESFTYSVSHDLRAPLRAIDGFARAFEEDYAGVVDEEGRRQLSVIRQNAVKMGQLIDDLLKFSRLGRRSISRSRVDMSALAREAIDDATRSAPDRELRFEVEELPSVNGDAALLRQVWINLVSNAVKYTRSQREARIEVAGRLDEDQATFLVRDNGVGFDMKYVGKLFGVFQRLHKSSEFEGTGVGLALVKRIIDRHGGRISATSEQGVGSTFTFTLPTGERIEL